MASLLDSTSLRVSFKVVVVIVTHLIDVFSYSFYWRSVISYRVEFYPKSSQSFGMESMFVLFFFVSYLVQNKKRKKVVLYSNITLGLGPQLIDILSITSVMIDVYERID